MKRAIMISGAGRSGTSTVAGSLSMLGLHVPQPEVPADETNPRGFFETQWVVDFHKKLLDRGPVVRTIDARPGAVELIQRHVDDPEVQAELDAWLRTEAGHDQLIVKDPRAIWFHELWRQGVRRQGAEMSYLTMLRHPAEVAKSRDTHYVSDRDERWRMRRAVANVAGWCNVTFVADLVTRDDQRVFVRYTDLLENWRTALAPVAGRLGLEVNTDLNDLSGQHHHAVDDFIDSGLRRSQTSWDDHDMPASLTTLAESLWQQTNLLVDDPHDADALAAIDELREEYGRLHEYSVAIAMDHTGTREVQARRQTRRELARLEDERRLRRNPVRRVVRAIRNRNEPPESLGEPADDTHADGEQPLEPTGEIRL